MVMVRPRRSGCSRSRHQPLRWALACNHVVNPTGLTQLRNRRVGMFTVICAHVSVLLDGIAMAERHHTWDGRSSSTRRHLVCSSKLSASSAKVAVSSRHGRLQKLVLGCDVTSFWDVGYVGSSCCVAVNEQSSTSERRIPMQKCTNLARVEVMCRSSHARLGNKTASD